MNYTYIFTRDDGRVITYDEQMADRMFKRGQWEARDITYLGRIKENDLREIYDSFGTTYTSNYVTATGQMSPGAEHQELKRRADQMQVLWNLIKDKVKEVGDKTEPRDFSVLNERGQIQNNQNVIGQLQK